jgi:hypothetical protein
LLGRQGWHPIAEQRKFCARYYPYRENLPLSSPVYLSTRPIAAFQVLVSKYIVAATAMFAPSSGASVFGRRVVLFGLPHFCELTFIYEVNFGCHRAAPFCLQRDLERDAIAVCVWFAVLELAAHPDKLGGIVEVDESFIGGKDKNKHWDKRGHGGKHAPSTKTPVIGAVQRKGNVVARVLDAVGRYQAEGFVREVVSTKVSLLATDESRIYGGLTEYNHQTVHHAAKQYVVGAVHTNTIEGFWSIFKRSVVGSYHKVSAKYLPLYIAECQFKYNNRFNDDIFGTAIAGC